jgi:response regulator of citrate/malate metabolism
MPVNARTSLIHAPASKNDPNYKMWPTAEAVPRGVSTPNDTICSVFLSARRSNNSGLNNSNQNSTNASTSSLRRCLIVERNVIIFMDLENIIQSAGIEIIDHADTADHALQMIERTHYDFAFIDCDSVSNRVELLVKELRRNHGLVAAIASGKEDQELQPALRGCPLILKPFTIATVEGVLRKFLMQ